MTRVIGFKKYSRKDGLSLTSVFVNTVEEFNEKIHSLKVLLGYLFPVKLHPLPLFELNNMNSLSVDGALISKVKMISKRIPEYNPTCIVVHCGNHCANFVVEDSLKHSDHLKECHQISLKLFDLINASPKFTDLFKECQVSTGEANQFKAGKPVEIYDRPMRRWESTLKFNSKLIKLALSIESFLAEVKERNWADNPNQSTIYPARWLSRKFPTPEYPAGNCT